MRRAYLLVVLVVGAVLIAAPAPPARGHTGDQLARPIVERVTPAAPGVEVEVVFTANYQFLVENRTERELTVIADAGEPFIRIGPDGVFGNFKSKAWYNSNVPEGLLRFPEGAEEGPEVEPVWRKVATEPVWGWYDHRLHPVERYLSKEVLESVDPVDLGDWEVPIRLGDEKGEIRGRFEYRPQLGTYRSVLKSTETPAEQVKVQVVSARTGIPAIFIENLSPATVTVLGKKGEPFARIGPKVEVNEHSPTWVEIEQAKGETPAAAADADAEPQWRVVAHTPRWSWIELRAAVTEEPSREIALREGPTTVKNWRVPILIGDERTDLVGITQFVPIARLQEEARAGRTSGNGSSKLPLVVLIALATLGAGYFVIRPRRKAEAPAARHRSRSTPRRRR